jgi:hypothetical protein
MMVMTVMTVMGIMVKGIVLLAITIINVSIKNNQNNAAVVTVVSHRCHIIFTDITAHYKLFSPSIATLVKSYTVLLSS